MEKIYLKPISKEIITRGIASDGYSDVFSYMGGPTDESKKRGSLFVVGHVNHKDEDLAYLINLVSALAKREYYAKPSLPQKEAFANALRKVNEVVEEFFQAKNLDMNIGIFSVCNEQLLISKLGKFKIILARDNKNVDVLNNIQLFEKDHVQPGNEFSNIISGKIRSKDRILAFYPGQPITSREKYIKGHFLSLSLDDFIEKINTLKQKHDSFSCALLYITVKKITEVATVPKIQPQELANAQLANVSEKPRKRGRAIVKKKEDIVMETKPEETKTTKELPVALATNQEAQVPPRIIPSEFSLGKRDSALDVLLRKIRFLKPKLGKSTKLVLASIIVVLLASTFMSVKSRFFISPEIQEARTILKTVQTSIESAKNSITEQNTSDARNMLFGSISNLQSVNSTEGTEQAKIDVYSLLNEMDNANDTSHALTYPVAEEFGIALDIAAYDGKLFVLTYDDSSATGYLLIIAEDELESRFPIKGMHADRIFANEGLPILLDTHAGKIGYIDNDEDIVVTEPKLPPSLLDAGTYQNNLYTLHHEGVYKVGDAAKGYAKVTQWLAEDEGIPNNALRVAIDGNIYVLTDNGEIITYYKGTKAEVIEAPFYPDKHTEFISPEDSLLQYLVHYDTSRIYVIDKKTGTLTKTYVIDTLQEITNVAVENDGTIYFLTKDNKVWRVR